MIKRFEADNYRCFSDFVFDLEDQQTALIVGLNGSGKSTLRSALGVLQTLCLESGSLGDALSAADFGLKGLQQPLRLGINVILNGVEFRYEIVCKMPERVLKPEILSESLMVDCDSVFSREEDAVNTNLEGSFGLDSHIAALKVFSSREYREEIELFRDFLSTMLLLSPIPSRMEGFSKSPSSSLAADASNFGDWFTDFTTSFPASYPHIAKFLTEVLPDFVSFENQPRGPGARQLRINFKSLSGEGSFSVDFDRLSDGEKSFFLAAVIHAKHVIGDPLFCFWDEPDNHLSLLEVDHFVLGLRKQLRTRGQFVATSHHPTSIRQFTDESTIIFRREDHTAPTQGHWLKDIGYEGDLIEALKYDGVLR
jgi:predicted ATPase